MTSIGTFPFGQPICNVVQTDRAPKRVFVLGVYASAVHAQWIGVNQKTIVNALAVASEPYIFWRGENAESIVRNIAIPPQLGRLVPARQQFNGPSGIALDDLIIGPLGLTRADAWLCDLVPHSCVNLSQKKALKRVYLPVAQQYALPTPTGSPVPRVLADEKRREAIVSEIHESNAGVLILLGDQPIQWFLSHYDQRWNNLKGFGSEQQTYGRLHRVRVDGRIIDVLPLAHPRQIAKLGRSSVVWHDLHQSWINGYASSRLNS
jgi:uracil-DNA glycosylase